GPVAPRPPPQQGEHLAPVALVEPLEGRDAGAGHRALKRTPASRCEVMDIAVVGHVEWVEFARVDHTPEPGEIVHALETWAEPAGLPWEALRRCAAVYFVSGDVAALRAARNCAVLVATARELETLRRAAVQVDVLVGSGEDAAERFESGELEPAPQIVVTTAA